MRGSADIWIVFPVLFWESAVQQFFSPAQQAMVPRLVPDGQLFVANALNGQIGDVSRLAGSALGGVIAAVGGITAVTLADAASFAASALLLLPVRTSGVGDSYRGRLFGALGAAQGIAVLVGTLAAGYLSRSLGIIPVLAVQGAVWTLAGLGLVVVRRYEGRAGDLDRSALEMPHQVGDLGGRRDHPGGDRGDPLLRQPEGGA